jgi:hypothetical protein
MLNNVLFNPINQYYFMVQQYAKPGLHWRPKQKQENKA